MNNKIFNFWQDKCVVVTGASSGLGRAVVEALAPFQIRFCLLSRRESEMLELALRLKDSGSTFWIKTCDVRKKAQVYSAIRDFHRQTGRIDAVWVNSGIGGSSALSEWKWDRIHDIIETNLVGAMYTIIACLEFMVDQKSGVVIGIGSATAMRPIPTRGVYSLSKIGLEYLIESLAIELPEIQFTMIHPGFVDTPMVNKRKNTVWIVQPERAAKMMIRAVTRGKSFYIFPYRMSLLYRIVRLLPRPLYRKLAKRVVSNGRNKN